MIPVSLRFSSWFNRSGWRSSIIAIPYVWLIFFFLLPFVIVFAMSLAMRAPTSPPIAYLPEWPYVVFDNYARLVGDPIYIRSYLISIRNATIATVLCLIFGYPMALAITRVSRSWRNILLMLVILPFWTSFLLRVYAWMGLMGSNSWFNRGLTSLFNAVVPADMALRYIPMMNTNFAVVLVMVYSYLPFMILPLYANLEKLDMTLNEAAMDLGSKPWQVFKDITLPLSLPGIIAGGLLVFIPASIGCIISDEFASARHWPMASAVAVALLMLLVAPLMIYNHFEAKAQAGGEAK